MHSWHIAFQDLFSSFELYSSKNIVKCPFSQVKLHKLTKENISKKKGMLLCYGAILFFPLAIFLLKNQIVGRLYL
jgi:hypothetical protein